MKFGFLNVKWPSWLKTTNFDQKFVFSNSKILALSYETTMGGANENSFMSI